MIEISFENEYGTVLISGENGILDLTETSGLSIPESEVLTSEFYNLPGQKVVSKRDKARLITMVGIKVRPLFEAASILYGKGVLHIVTNRINREIEARCIKMSDRCENGKITLVFECDNPYFHETDKMTVSVYNRIKKVSSPFTLPCVFSERITEGVVKNLGMVESEPEIYIENFGNQQNGFIIRNCTTNKAFRYTLPVKSGEKITISVPDRKVFNNFGENLLQGISENSYIKDMVLAVGDNLLKFEGTGDMRCTLSYNTNFTEAVI